MTRKTILVIGTMLILMTTPMALAKKDPPAPPANCTDYEFHYTDGHSDIGQYCDKGNDIKSGLHVTKLHISCSDTFPDGQSNGKSDLDGHTIAAWSIVKYDKEGEVKKTCGQGEIPFFPAPAAMALGLLGMLGAVVAIRRFRK